MKYVQIPEETAKLIHSELLDVFAKAADKDHAKMLFGLAHTLTNAINSPVKKAGRPKKTLAIKDFEAIDPPEVGDIVTINGIKMEVAKDISTGQYFYKEAEE